MTREKAIAIVLPMYGGGTAEIIGIWEALGMLKLDEPKSAQTEFFDVVRREINAGAAAQILGIIRDYGFKIIEK